MAWRTSSDWESWKPSGEEESTRTAPSLRKHTVTRNIQASNFLHSETCTHPPLDFIVAFWGLALSITFPQVWISWSSCRATRTKRSTRRHSTWLSATSAPRTRIQPWLLPSTCSNSSSFSRSVKLQWRASSSEHQKSPSGERVINIYNDYEECHVARACVADRPP